MIDYEHVWLAALAKYYPEEGARREAEAVLSRYGADDAHREIPRVRAAILKLSGSDLDRLARETAAASCDWRDVLGPAEYPRQMKGPLKSENPDRHAELKQQDLETHQGWLDSVLGQ